MIPFPYQVGGVGRFGSAGNAAVTSLLNFNGTNGSTTFTDAKGLTWTAFGNAQLSTTTPKFGTACLLLDGTGDYATTPTATAFEFGTGDFTVEAWVRPTAGTFGSSPNILSNRAASGGMTFRMTTGQNLQFFPGPAAIIVTSTGTITADVYTHVAVARQSGTTRLFIGGVLDGTLSDPINYSVAGNAAATTSVGRSQFGGNEFFTGRIDDLRVTRGLARYTATFTPPTAELLDEL